MKKADIETIKDILSSPKKMVIVTHYNPDGDAIGSSLALLLYLQQYKHQVSVLVPNSLPDYLTWMPESENILIATEQSDICKEKIEEADIIFCLDFNAFNRVGQMQEFLEQSKTFKILIDHHISPMKYFNLKYSLTDKTSSTSELVYRLIVEKLADKKHFTKAMAECLYVGIMTDTGSMSYSCNNPSTYRVLSALVDYKIDGEKIHRRVYDTYSESRLHLLGYCLFKKLVVLKEFSTSYMLLTKADLDFYNYQQGDTEGIVNYGLSIKEVRFTAFFTERDDRVRISFRSKGNFDVNVLAKQHFNGGGHKNAAGGNFYGNIYDAVNLLLKILPSYKEQLNQPWDD